MCPRGDGKGVVLELQHSSISEEERSAREAFYSKEHRMFWLLNMHRTTSLEFSFGQCLNFKEGMHEKIGGHDFYHMEWIMRGTMLDKWKQSRAHVFLHYGSRVYYLATNAACRSLVSRQAKGQFALAPLTVRQFLTAVAGEDLSALALPTPEARV